MTLITARMRMINSRGVPAHNSAYNIEASKAHVLQHRHFHDKTVRSTATKFGKIIKEGTSQGVGEEGAQKLVTFYTEQSTIKIPLQLFELFEAICTSTLTSAQLTSSSSSTRKSKTFALLRLMHLHRITSPPGVLSTLFVQPQWTILLRL